MLKEMENEENEDNDEDPQNKRLKIDDEAQPEQLSSQDSIKECKLFDRFHYKFGFQ